MKHRTTRLVWATLAGVFCCVVAGVVYFQIHAWHFNRQLDRYERISNERLERERERERERQAEFDAFLDRVRQ